MKNFKVSDRLFLLDKNYLLKEAQANSKLELQARLVELVKEGYFQLFNPLRLPDERTDLIENFKPTHLSFFDELYDVLAGIYRYNIGDNQLELLFDGRSHYEMYMTDWPKAFEEYVNDLCSKKNFVLAGLELSVFHDPSKRIELAQNRMKVSIFDHFGLRIYKYKGIQKLNSKSA